MSSRLVIYSVLVTSVLMLAACGGSGTSPKASSGGAGSTTVSGSTATVNVKKFCTNYAKAANLLQYGVTDSTVITDLKNAQTSAPQALETDVTKILNVVEQANSAKSATKYDVTQESTQISNWANSHC
jgi:hypothetical protein